MQSFQIEKTDSRCIVTWRHFSVVAIILLPWFLCWTAFCIVFAYKVLIQQQFDVLFGAMLFYVIEIVVFAIVANMLFGETRITLDETGLHTLYTCLWLKLEKHYDLAELVWFGTRTVRHKRGRVTYQFQMVCQNENVDFLHPAKDSKIELESLCEQLNEVLGALKGPGTARSTAPSPALWVLDLQSPVQHLEPPLKCRWLFQSEYDGFGFQYRGASTIKGLVGAFVLLACFFGVVCAIDLSFHDVMPEENRPEIAEMLFAFLIMFFFACAVLLLVYAVIILFYNYFRSRLTNWTFTHGEAKCRIVRLGSARYESHNLTDWNSLVGLLVSAKANCDDWQLAFLNVAGEELLTIEKLTKPEALWMADVLLREQRTIR